MLPIDLAQWIIPDLKKKRLNVQIENFILGKIKNRIVEPGEQIPAYRILASINKVNKNTVLPIYTRLISKGWLVSKHGGKTHVSNNIPPYEVMEDKERSYLSSQHILPLNAKRISSLKFAVRMPFVSIGASALNLSCSPQETIARYTKQYRLSHSNATQVQMISDDEGTYLHAAVHQYMRITRGIDLQPDQLMIMHGYHETIRQLIKLIVPDGTDIVNTAEYELEASFILQDCIVNIHNLDPFADDFLDKLENLIAERDIKALYIRPGCMYPKGQRLKSCICKKLVELAMKHQFYILECDDDHEFWNEDKPFKLLWQYPHQGQVIYCGALSRLSPYLQNIRTVITSGSVIAWLRTIPLAYGVYRDHEKDMAIAKMLTNGELAGMIRTARSLKKSHLKELGRILNEYLGDYIKYEMPESGTSVWLCFPASLNLRKVLVSLESKGFNVPYHPPNQVMQKYVHHMRLDISYFNLNECLTAAIELQKILKNLLKY